MKSDCALYLVVLSVVLLHNLTAAFKVRRNTTGRLQGASVGKLSPDAAEQLNASTTTASVTVQPETPTGSDKEVHKRDIFFGVGSALAGPAAVATNGLHYLRKPYAAHYGYNFHHLPTVNGFAVPGIMDPTALVAPHVPPSELKHTGSGFQYKVYGGGLVVYSPETITLPNQTPFVDATLADAHQIGAAWPANMPASAAHFPHAQYVPVGPGVAGSPFQLRPGGAWISSYKVQYPQLPKPALAVFNSVHPIQPITPALPEHQVTPVQPHLSHHIHSFPQLQVQSTAQVAPVQPLRPLHFHTAFVQPHPQTPTFPSAPALPAIPAFPAPPAFPIIPSVPVPVPTQDTASPPAPAFPVFTIHTTVPEPLSPPVNAFPGFAIQPTPPMAIKPVFPASGVQPPPRQPLQPPIASGGLPLDSAASFPDFASPLPGTPTTNTPQIGSAEASPEISASSPQPNLETTQEPWRPLVYGPPPIAPRPSITLQPPYDSTIASPSQGYLPPFSSALNLHRQQQKQQHTHLATDNLFENLSEAEIDLIINQAKSAAQQQTQSHRRYHHPF